MIQITNDRGVPFNVRVVMPGDRYGRDDCLVHDDEFGNGPMIEFYDARYVKGFSERGQFVSRYYIKTLLEGASPHSGLCLDGGVPDWSLTGMNVREALAYTKGKIAFRDWQDYGQTV